MGKSIWGRITLIAVLTAASIILVLPSLTDSLPVAWREKSPKIPRGLDLRGGVFLRLAVEIDKAIENTTLRYADDARAILREKGIPVLAMAKNGIDGFSLTLPPGDFADRAMKGLKEGVGTVDYTLGSVTSSGATIQARMTPGEVQAIRANAVTQGVETIRNRIDQFGVREPQIVAGGGSPPGPGLPSRAGGSRRSSRKGRTASSSSFPASRTSSGPSSWWGRPRSWSSSSWTRGRAWRRRSKETSARTTSSCT